MDLLGDYFQPACLVLYVQQRDSVCGIDSINYNYIFIIMNMSTTVWLNDVFLISFGQHWSFMAQRNKIYQALGTQTILINRVSLLLVLVFPWDLLSQKKPYRIPPVLSVNRPFVLEMHR